MKLPLLITALLLTAAPAAAKELPDTIEVVIESTASRGLPTDLLRQKAQEGLSKGVPLQQVESVLTRMSQELDRAEVLLSTDDAAVLNAAGRALRLGASESSVLTLYRLDEGVRVKSLNALSDLLAVGLGANQSVQLVRGVATSPSGHKHLGQIAVLVATRISRGSTPAAAAADVSTNLGVVSEVSGGPGQSGNAVKAWATGKAKGGKKRR